MMLEIILLALQALQVLFLWIHDWIPLGRFNDVASVRAQDSRTHLVVVTLIQSVPFTIGLVYSWIYFPHHYPLWLRDWLWISYGLLFIGELRAWWVPYLFRPEPVRAERYRVAYGNTISFLPVRNGMVPNAAHTMLHLATAGTLICLLLRHIS
jgi:hypothetical protein